MSKETVLITGGSGMVATSLSKLLVERGFEVILLSRSLKTENSYLWDYKNNFIDNKAIKKCQYIVHLAGASVAGSIWTEQSKKEIIDSRVNTTELLVLTLRQQNKELKAVVAASAVGYYGSTTSTHIFHESDNPGSDFLAHTCVLWEKATKQFEKHCDRLIQLRIGIVLDSKGGALKKMAAPVHYWAGAAVGNGEQYMPWIHIDDLCNFILYSLQHENVQGVYNAVSSEQVTNKEFVKKIAKVLKKPVFLPAIPSIMIKSFLGDMSKMILEGSQVSNEKILSTGFTFKYNKLEEALKDLLS